MKYACSDCCKTAKECDEKIDSWLRDIRPPAPSTPPPKKYTESETIKEVLERAMK